MKGEYIWVVAEDHQYPGDETLDIEVFETEEDAQNFAEERKKELRRKFLIPWIIKETPHFFEMRNKKLYFIVRVTKKEIK